MNVHLIFSNPYPNARSGIISGLIWPDKDFIWPDQAWYNLLWDKARYINKVISAPDQAWYNLIWDKARYINKVISSQIKPDITWYEIKPDI